MYVKLSSEVISSQKCCWVTTPYRDETERNVVRLLTDDDVMSCTIRLPLLALDTEEEEFWELQSPDDEVACTENSKKWLVSLLRLTSSSKCLLCSSQVSPAHCVSAKLHVPQSSNVCGLCCRPWLRSITLVGAVTMTLAVSLQPNSISPSWLATYLFYILSLARLQWNCTYTWTVRHTDFQVDSWLYKHAVYLPQ